VQNTNELFNTETNPVAFNQMFVSDETNYNQNQNDKQDKDEVNAF
jgi:hypothetical protein